MAKTACETIKICLMFGAGAGRLGKRPPRRFPPRRPRPLRTQNPPLRPYLFAAPSARARGNPSPRRARRPRARKTSAGGAGGVLFWGIAPAWGGTPLPPRPPPCRAPRRLCARTPARRARRPAAPRARRPRARKTPARGRGCVLGHCVCVGRAALARGGAPLPRRLCARAASARAAAPALQQLSSARQGAPSAPAIFSGAAESVYCPSGAADRSRFSSTAMP